MSSLHADHLHRLTTIPGHLLVPHLSGWLCRDSDEDTDEEGPAKPVPDWARGKQLLSQLTAQVRTDPDEIFQQHLKTCTLDDVFKHGSGESRH